MVLSCYYEKTPGHSPHPKDNQQIINVIAHVKMAKNAFEKCRKNVHLNLKDLWGIKEFNG